MKQKLLWAGLLPALLLASACKSQYKLAGISRSRILVDSRYDAAPDARATAFLQPYKRQVDSIMSPVVGSVARYMAAGRPESELSNLLADILVWGGRAYGEQPVMGVYNMGGIRAAFAKGQVTNGDVIDVAPFENKICFLTLRGDRLLQLFREMAAMGGEGVSHGVELVITADGKLKSARLNGRPIDPAASYRIATLDYLAQGNDKLEAFKQATQVVSPQDQQNNVRFIIMDYFREQTKAGKIVDSQKEGRIKVE
ncbi:5'-nucleotidase C-terminal domain-containing protein [Prevotella sp. kh1p2]|uniref:5'-nucleotidase C-terminal domain-containing protein n=1 Tax=Prevotella sp. kh1p2 TaxID=1761883 RepID=UPI0008B36DE5|nr:5'-nucleotidase [Prevotella sp. kh1p2]SES64113.1 5'-nucleotidase, C-terminal domain [Prevotella sp. kh1p2]SNU10099.1 5'-nucleotidase, C-terminal domain [Prevotellaceae bacterium KH2P17]